jgi:hypothetical protein
LTWKQSALKVLDLQGNKLSHDRIPCEMLKESKIHNLNLMGNGIKRAELMRMEGLEEY